MQLQTVLRYSNTCGKRLQVYREHYVTVMQTALSYSYAGSIKLQLYRQHYVTVKQMTQFYNNIFKITQILYNHSVSLPSNKNIWMHTWY